MFADENGGIAMPASLGLRIGGKQPLPHLDYYVGKSAYTSSEKQHIIDGLKMHGATWSWTCVKCRPRTLERTYWEVKHGLYRFLIHPDLQNLMQLAAP